MKNKINMFVKVGSKNKTTIDNNILRWNDELASISATQKPTDNWTRTLKAFIDMSKDTNRLSGFYSATEEEKAIAPAFLLAGLEYVLIVFGLDKNDVAEISTAIYSRRWKSTGTQPIEWKLRAKFVDSSSPFNEKDTSYLNLEITFLQRRRSVELREVNAKCQLDFDIPDFLGCRMQLLINGQSYNFSGEASSCFNGAQIAIGDPNIKKYQNTILASKFCNGRAVTATFKGFKSSMENTQTSLVKGTLLSLSGMKGKSAKVFRGRDAEVQIGIAPSYNTCGDIFIIKF